VQALREPALAGPVPPGLEHLARRRARLHQLLKGKTDMIGSLFDSPWKILIVAVVLIVLFGSKKLPHAARSLGQSMRILKTEVGRLHDGEPELTGDDANK
jgi:sec-independent protein translocase protein TatA